jgi:hypothetical protein
MHPFSPIASSRAERRRACAGPERITFRTAAVVSDRPVANRQRLPRAATSRDPALRENAAGGWSRGTTAGAGTSQNRAAEVREHHTFIALWSMVCGETVPPACGVASSIIDCDPASRRDEEIP